MEKRGLTAGGTLLFAASYDNRNLFNSVIVWFLILCSNRPRALRNGLQFPKPQTGDHLPKVATSRPVAS